jgi:acetylglutamate/LysW-gamma-L-alpha-aminoadipate kinase
MTMCNLCVKKPWGSKQTLSEFLSLFLQKESGFQGKALRISKNILHTLYRRAYKKRRRIMTHTPDNLLVIKLGGGEGLDMSRACADIARIARQRPVIVVHGVSARMNQFCHEQNIPVRTLTSPTGHTSRYTNPQTRDVFVSACRSVNREIITHLQSHGIDATGFRADDAIVIQGERKQALRAVVDGRTRIIRDDYSGSITHIEAVPLLEQLEAGCVPVVPPLADSADGLLNIDGDRAAAELAAALQAGTYVILSNVRGLYRNYPDEDSLVSEIPQAHLSQAMQWAQGRMKRKVLGAQEALEGGVQRVIISDGRNPQPVSEALNGAGTTFINDHQAAHTARRR